MFSSNLGARAVQCNPQNVSGKQRYRFFATALTDQNEAQGLKKRRMRKPEQAMSFKSSHNESSRYRIRSQDEKDDRQVSSSLVSNGTQTDTVKIKEMMVSSTSSLDSSKQNQPPQNDPPKSKELNSIELEKISREKERKEQEATLPPLTDKESLEAYRVFLEENERKDFALREKELDAIMRDKLKRIKEDLHCRYRKENDMNQTKIELIRKSKLASLKEKHTCNEDLKKGVCLSMKQQPESIHSSKIEGTIGFDFKSNPTKNNNRIISFFPRRSKNQIKKAKEDLDLVTSYFNKKY